MTIYWALWIPTLKVGKLSLAKNPGRRKIRDNIKWEPYFLWSEVDKETFDFTLKYSSKDNTTSACSLILTQVENNNHGFIVYSVEVPDEDDGDSFLTTLREKGMSPSIYHFIKDHFHSHVHHDSNEDALLKCLSSRDPLTLKTETGKAMIANHYLDLYATKFNNFLKDITDDHARARTLVNNGMTTAKGINMYAEIIKSGRIIAGEYEFCNFLMQHYNSGRAQQNRSIRDTMTAIRSELEACSSDYQLCTNAYSTKLGIYGIWAGVLGILISTGGIMFSCLSDKSFEPVIQKEDSIKIDIEYLKKDIDSVHGILIKNQIQQSNELQEINKKIQQMQKRK